VQVKSAVEPALPVELSPLEERDLKPRATALGAQALEAKVQLERTFLSGRVWWRGPL